MVIIVRSYLKNTVKIDPIKPIKLPIIIVVFLPIKSLKILKIKQKNAPRKNIKD